MKGDYEPDKFSENDVLYITLSNCATKAIVDLDRRDLSFYHWSLHTRGYAMNHKRELLHHLCIGKPSKGMVVDHINGNKLDNTRKNLRFCTPIENQKNRCINKNNSSGYPGVNTVPSGRYIATIWHNRKKINLGTWGSFSEAVLSRKKGEKKYGASVRTR